MSSDVRILIVDDEPAIRNLLKISFLSGGFKVEEAENGEQGLKRASEFHPHLIILDLGLPDIDGLYLLKELRKWTKVPVIVLTVSDDEKSKVTLLDAGADDYLTKPFGVPELLARVRVALRNHGLVEATPIFKSKGLEVDLNQRSVKVDNIAVKLTNTEFELLAVLVRENGKVIPQVQILKQIWGAAFKDQIHYLRIYINQLRKKIELDPSHPEHIITEPGVGYRIV